MSDTYGYNEYGEPVSYVASYNGTAMFSETWTRDTGGRISGQAETAGGVTATYGYGYDEAGRLTSVTKDGASQASFTYDANSNRLTRSTPAGTESGTYDGEDRMTSYGGASYAWTASGELVSRTDAQGTSSYAWDVMGNLREVQLASGTSVTYVMDAQNRRVGKKLNGTLVRGWLYGDSLRIVAELSITSFCQTAWIRPSGPSFARQAQSRSRGR